MAEPIEVLPALLSLDVTAGLVAQGLRAPWTAGAEQGDPAVFTRAILGASNTTPIVITVAAGDLGVIAPRVGTVIHVVVAGVVGNLAANKVDPVTLRNEAWVGVVTSETTLALYDIDVNTGELVASVGSGAYVSGGTLSKALIDGSILVGQENIGETSAAPRIVMVPKRCDYEGPNAASSWTPSAISDDEPGREDLAPAIRTRTIHYETHVWGKGASVLASFGVCDRIADQLIRSAQDRCSGVYETGPGVYLDQVPNMPQRLKYGHEYVFDLGLAVPVLRDALTFAPDGTLLAPDLYLEAEGNPPEPVNE